MRFPKVVIYDLDGTLVDSAQVVAQILNEMRSLINFEHLDIETVRLLTAKGGEEMIREALCCAEDQVSGRLKRFREKYARKSTGTELLFPGVRTILTTIKRAGSFLCICTNKPRLLTEKTLKDTGIHEFFDYSICQGEARRDKPNPDPLNEIIDLYKVARSQSLFIGDTRTDLQASRRARIDFIFFDSGYDLNMRAESGLKTINNHKQILDLF